MKILIASDIHGSAFWCGKLTDVFRTEQCDRLWLLGDILYHGPRNDLPAEYAPKKVIAMLNPLRELITCVRGNCDAEVDQMVLDFDLSRDNLRLSGGGAEVLLTHGHHVCPDSPAGAGLLCGADTVLYGHTHIPDDRTVDGIRYINPGSVSIPKNGSANQCLILENGDFQRVCL